MINSDPAMTLNRCSSEAISPIVPIAVTTPCPRCGAVPLNVRSHLLFAAVVLLPFFLLMSWKNSVISRRPPSGS